MKSMKTRMMIAAASGLTFSGITAAELVTIGFDGFVSTVNEELGLPISTEIEMGEPVSGTITFDNGATNSGSSNQGRFTGAVVDHTMTIGDYTITWTPGPNLNEVETNNDNLNGPFRGDHVRIRDLGVAGTPIVTGELQHMDVNLSDAENIVFPDNASTQSLNPTHNFPEFETGSLYVSWSEPIDGGPRCRGCPTVLSGYMLATITNVYFVPACEGDYNGDSIVDFDDLNVVLSGWQLDYDFDDLNLVLANWDTDCSQD